jgi:enoyl-CoA hydratase / 3-hydroxyacyl-CoA dehydrogenase
VPSPRRIPLTFIDLQVTDGLATLTLNRPQVGNALNWAMLEQLRSVLRQTCESRDVAAIVIAAAGNHFVSGADVGFFVRSLDAGDVPRIVEYTRASQDVFAEIAACPKPVVAAVQGAAVGGGFELALACHAIVATPRASFSFPETALGIVPSLGGTYRTPRRIGVELTKWLVYTGHVLPPPKAVALGLVDQLVMPDELPAAANLAARKLCERPTAAPAQTIAPADEFAALRSLFAGATIAELRSAPPSGDRVVSTVLKALSSRPPSALEWSERLIDAALASTLEQGAAAALAAVLPLFENPEVHALLSRAAQLQRKT